MRTLRRYKLWAKYHYSTVSSLVGAVVLKLM